MAVGPDSAEEVTDITLSLALDCHMMPSELKAGLSHALLSVQSVPHQGCCMRLTCQRMQATVANLQAQLTTQEQQQQEAAEHHTAVRATLHPPSHKATCCKLAGLCCEARSLVWATLFWLCEPCCLCEQYYGSGGSETWHDTAGMGQRWPKTIDLSCK